MKKAGFKRFSARLSLVGCLLFAASCGRLGEIREFQLYDGNESLPPPYQRILIIRGRIEPDKIAVSYSYCQSAEKLPPESLELTGEDRAKCLRMIENTSLRTNLPISAGGAFDVTLIDESGKNKMGAPSNAADWQQFAAEIKEKTQAEKHRN